MSILIVASSEPRAGRSMIAAAIAFRMTRNATPVTLVRVAGDDSAAADAATFASIEGVASLAKPLAHAELSSLAGSVIAEASAGPVADLLHAVPAARVLIVGDDSLRPVAPSEAIVGRVLTRVPAGDVAHAVAASGVLAVLVEDRQLAAPSVQDIATALRARFLARAGGSDAIERVMVGTISADAASPYFDDHERKCVITRFDKTDVQLAALNTDLECMVLTGGGDPSPYLMDRVASSRDDIAVLLADGTTVEAMHAIEGLYATSRFSGARKLERVVSLLDAASFALPF